MGVIGIQRGFFRIFGAGRAPSERVRVRGWRSRGVKNTAAREVEFGASVHLPLQHLQPVDPPRDGTVAPRLRQGGANGRSAGVSLAAGVGSRRAARRLALW